MSMTNLRMILPDTETFPQMFASEVGSTFALLRETIDVSKVKPVDEKSADVESEGGESGSEGKRREPPKVNKWVHRSPCISGTTTISDAGGRVLSECTPFELVFESVNYLDDWYPTAGGASLDDTVQVKIDGEAGFDNLNCGKIPLYAVPGSRGKYTSSAATTARVKMTATVDSKAIDSRFGTLKETQPLYINCLFTISYDNTSVTDADADADTV